MRGRFPSQDASFFQLAVAPGPLPQAIQYLEHRSKLLASAAKQSELNTSTVTTGFSKTQMGTPVKTMSRKYISFNAPTGMG